ncbi:Interleukin-17 receptor A [Apodemus speciosus]|uniref:Interleukin-17 receptor A n=1 Tax=Apodemus speciosus TaxID=105296 RepID=A0ABQ0EWS0_APOSI
MAASAAERSGPGPRLPAPPRLPGSRLRAGGAELQSRE